MFCRKMIIGTLLMAVLLISFGISDSEAQPAAIPCATGDCEFTISADVGYVCDVSVTTEEAVGNDHFFDYPYGLISFKVQLDPCDSMMNPASAERTSKAGMFFSPMVTLTFFKHSDDMPLSLMGLMYRRHGPTAMDSMPHWYDFMYDMMTMTGAEISSNVVMVHFRDGQRGDDDMMADGVILDAGGPAQMATNVPTMNEWGMIIFMALAGIGSLYYLRKRRRTEN